MVAMWRRMTPVATKAQHHDAEGADNHARPPPTTSEDEGCQVPLHRLRLHLAPLRDRTRGSIFFLRFELYWHARVLTGPLLSPYPLFVDLYYYDYVRLSGSGPQVGPFPSRPILGSIRGEGTPPQTLSII